MGGLVSRSRGQQPMGVWEECGRPGIPPESAVYPVPPRPMLNADADHLGLVRLMKPDVPPALDVAAGTLGRGLVLDTRSGRSPLYR